MHRLLPLAVLSGKLNPDWGKNWAIISTDNATALRKAALGGHGIAYVPRCLVYHDIRNGQLVDIFPELVGKKLGIYAVYPFTRQPPNKTKPVFQAGKKLKSV